MAQGTSIIVGLDVGTSKVATVVAEVDGTGSVNVIGIGLAPSHGLRKGVVVNIEQTTQAIQDSIAEADRMAAVVIDDVYVGISGAHISSFNTKGVVSAGGEDREILYSDIERAIEAAKTFAVPANRHILHILPRSFRVDDQEGILDPVGMSGVRLEVDVHIVMAALTALQNLRKACERANLYVVADVLSPIASAEAVLTRDEKDLGVCLIDLGGGTTDIAVYQGGTILHSAALPVGGNHISNDIAIGLRTTANRAEELKIRHGCALTRLDQSETAVEVLNTGGESYRTVTTRSLCEIVEPRMEEIFLLVRAELEKTGLLDYLSAGAVLTGGTAMMKGASQVAREVLGVPVRTGRPINLKGLAEKVGSPLFSTGVGLIHYGIAYEANSGVERYHGTSLVSIMAEKMRGWFREVF